MAPPPWAPLPRLPKPLPVAALQEILAGDGVPAEEHRTTVETYLLRVGGWVDTLKLAVEQNHADFKAGRPSWSYDDRLQVDSRVKALSRQRQALQLRFGEVNRQRKTAEHLHREAVRSEYLFAEAFVRAARELLDQETYSMLSELAAAHCVQTDVGLEVSLRPH